MDALVSFEVMMEPMWEGMTEHFDWALASAVSAEMQQKM
jgi:hypothetical protein